MAENQDLTAKCKEAGKPVCFHGPEPYQEALEKGRIQHGTVIGINREFGTHRYMVDEQGLLELARDPDIKELKPDQQQLLPEQLLSGDTNPGGWCILRSEVDCNPPKYL